MNKLRVAFWLVVGLVAFGVVWTYAVPWEVKDAAQERVARTLNPPPQVEQYDSFGPWEFGATMPKTAVPGENLSYSFTIKQAIWVNMGAAGGYGLLFEMNSSLLKLSFVGILDDPKHPGEWGLRVSDYVGPFAHTFWYETPTDAEGIYWIELPVSVTMSGSTATRLTHSTTPIGEKGATHAKECVLAEEWFIPAGTTFTLDVGGETYQGAITSDRFAALTLDVYGNGIDSRDWVQGDNGMHPGVKYVLSIEDITFGPVAIDTSAFTARNWGSTPASAGKLWVEGFGGNSIGFWASEWFDQPPYTFDTYTGGAISAPLSYDFTNLQFLWMDGTNVDEALQVYCTGLRRLSVGGIDVGPWHGTIAELRALGRYTQQHGCYYWDTYEPDMQATVKLYLDLTSAESLGIEIRGPQPALKVEAAGWSGGQEWTEGYVSPYDGPYRPYAENVWTNGYGFLFKINEDGDHGIGPSPNASVPPYYIQEGGGPGGAYLVNTPSYLDSVVNEETGQRMFSGLAGPGVGPAVSTSTAEAILVDSDCADPAFTHDATFIFDAHNLASTSRSESPYMSGVVSLSVAASVDIYAQAHDHTHWAGTNCTTPDEDGWFTVGEGGGSLLLVLACNYRDRQSKVGGEGEISVPGAYRGRRHDSYYGEGVIPEPHEAAWDWRGFYFTQTFAGLSLPCNVTYTLHYYMDLLGISDNHKTDSTRQTEYSYDPGPLYTLTRTIPVTYADDEGRSPILIDLYDEKNSGQPVAMAYSIQWLFPEAGTYRMSKPYLTRDVGDRQEPAIESALEFTRCLLQDAKGTYRYRGTVNGENYYTYGTYAVYWMPIQKLWILHDYASLGDEDYTGGYYTTKSSQPTGPWRVRNAKVVV